MLEPDSFGFFFALNSKLFFSHHHGEVWEEHLLERLEI